MWLRPYAMWLWAQVPHCIVTAGGAHRIRPVELVPRGSRMAQVWAEREGPCTLPFEPLPERIILSKAGVLCLDCQLGAEND